MALQYGNPYDTMQKDLRYQTPGFNPMGDVGVLNNLGGMDRSQMGGIVDTAPGGPVPGAPQTPGQMSIQGGYTRDDFANWYRNQYGGDVSGGMVNRLGATIGPPQGPNGTYSQAQYQQAQQLAQQENPGFFPEFEAPTYQQGPAYQAPGPYQAGTYQAPDPYQAGTYQAPTPFEAPKPFEYGEFQGPQPFQYGAFNAPTAEQAMNDPGFQFSLNQGMKALQQGGAASGLARTGGAMKGLIDYAQDRSATQYQNVYNRAAQSYQMNRANAADTYNTNYGVSRDVYGTNRANAAENYATNYGVARNTWQDNAQMGLQAYQTNEDARFRGYQTNAQTGLDAFRTNEDARYRGYTTNAEVGRQAWADNETARQQAYDRNYQAASDRYNARFRGRELSFEDMFRRWQTQVATQTQLSLAND